MTSKYPMVSVKTMTDYHLASFIRCPYQFYYQHILSLGSSHVIWRQVVQSIINQVVRDFYQLSLDAQNKLSVMKLIDRYWKNVSPQLFESKSTYYIVLAKTTDHLLQFLSVKKNQKPPLLLFEKLDAYVEELETKLSVTVELAEWSTHSFTIKKFLLEADEEMIQLYKYFIAVFSNKAFGKLPEKLEILTLLEGEKYTFSLTKRDVAEGILYLEYMKNLLQDPNDYAHTNSLTECSSCPFTQKCIDNSFVPTKVNKLNLHFLH
jgi:CRISPR/Cas system-associated exonuclease Cas4 (RecB family)